MHCTTQHTAALLNKTRDVDGDADPLEDLDDDEQLDMNEAVIYEDDDDDEE